MQSICQRCGKVVKTSERKHREICPVADLADISDAIKKFAEDRRKKS